jgi:hypothetical protein
MGGNRVEKIYNPKGLTIGEVERALASLGAEAMEIRESKDRPGVAGMVAWRCAKGHCSVVCENGMPDEALAAYPDIAHYGGGRIVSSKTFRCGLCRQDKVRHLKDGRSQSEMVEIAREREGRCMTPGMSRVDDQIEWECDKGHRFVRSVNDVLHAGAWCDKCGGFKAERTIREFLEEASGLPWPKARPEWLSTPMGRLEMDGWCEELGAAFEHQGRQHDEYVSYFHKSPEEFARRREADKAKREALAKRGVILLEFPDLSHLPIVKIKEAVAKAMEAMAVPLPGNPDFERMLREA